MKKLAKAQFGKIISSAAKAVEKSGVKSAIKDAEKVMKSSAFKKTIKDTNKSAIKGGFNLTEKSLLEKDVAQKALNKRTSAYQNAVDDSYKKKGGVVKTKKKK